MLWGAVVRAVEKFSISSEAYLVKTRELGSVGRTGASFNSTIIDLINKVNKPALNRILQAYPSYIRVFGIINNKKLEILSKIGLKALPPILDS